MSPRNSACSFQHLCPAVALVLALVTGCSGVDASSSVEAVETYTGPLRAGGPAQLAITMVALRGDGREACLASDAVGQVGRIRLPSAFPDSADCIRGVFTKVLSAAELEEIHAAASTASVSSDGESKTFAPFDVVARVNADWVLVDVTTEAPLERNAAEEYIVGGDGEFRLDAAEIPPNLNGFGGLAFAPSVPSSESPILFDYDHDGSGTLLGLRFTFADFVPLGRIDLDLWMPEQERETRECGTSGWAGLCTFERAWTRFEMSFCRTPSPDCD